MLPITNFNARIRALKKAEPGLSNSQAARKLMVRQARDERPSPSQEAREILTDAALEQREELHLVQLDDERAEEQAEAVAAAGRVEAARPWHCDLPEGFDFSPEPWQEDE